MDHLDAAAQWICRTQDATPDDGVARSYSLIYQPYFKRKGWFPSYPETTGYIIPTMFDYARLSQRQEIHDRAVRMAGWETAVQMDNGAVMGGTVDNKPTPAIFNTGQGIFGWLRAYQETGYEQFMDSAPRSELEGSSLPVRMMTGPGEKTYLLLQVQICPFILITPEPHGHSIFWEMKLASRYSLMQP